MSVKNKKVSDKNHKMSDKIQYLIQEKQTITIVEMAKKLDVTLKTIERHLKNEKQKLLKRVGSQKYLGQEVKSSKF